MTLIHRTRSNNRQILSGVTLLYVASIPFDIFPVAAGRTLTGPLALLLIATWTISNLRNPETIRFPASAGTLLFLYCFWITCTVIWSSDPSVSMRALQSFLLQAPLVVILSNTLSHIWFRSLVTLGCSTGVLGLVVLARPGDPLRGGRASVGGIDENVTAMVLVTGFAVLVYAATHLGGLRAALLVPLAIVTGMATLHTGSRSGAIAAAAVLCVTLISLIWRGRIRPVVWFRAVGMVILAYFSFIIALDAALVPDRVVGLLNQGQAYGDDGRDAIIDLYLKTFDHWAFVGVGLGADASYLRMTESWYHNAHSLFWKTWIETGVIGLTLLAAFLIIVIKLGVRSVAPQAMILLAAPIVVFAITLGGATTSVFWFVVALALTQSPAASPAAESEQSQESVAPLPHTREQRGSVSK